jgi:hypothetical protein
VGVVRHENGVVLKRCLGGFFVSWPPALLSIIKLQTRLGVAQPPRKCRRRSGVAWRATQPAAMAADGGQEELLPRGMVQVLRRILLGEEEKKTKKK